MMDMGLCATASRVAFPFSGTSSPQSISYVEHGII